MSGIFNVFRFRLLSRLRLPVATSIGLLASWRNPCLTVVNKRARIFELPLPTYRCTGGNFHRQNYKPTNSQTFYIRWNNHVFRRKENWFILTAGHALEKLSRAVELELVEDLCIIDYISYLSTNRIPIPFAYEKKSEVAIFNENNGVDFGIYYIRDYYKNLIVKNKVTPLPENQWLRQPQHTASSDLSNAWPP